MMNSNPSGAVAIPATASETKDIKQISVLIAVSDAQSRVKALTGVPVPVHGIQNSCCDKKGDDHANHWQIRIYMRSRNAHLLGSINVTCS
jgi:hypothetical protein